MAKKKQEVADEVVAGIGNETPEEVYAELDKRGMNWPSNLSEIDPEADEEDFTPAAPAAPAAPRITARGNKREEGSAVPVARRQSAAPKARRKLTSGNLREDS